MAFKCMWIRIKNNMQQQPEKDFTKTKVSFQPVRKASLSSGFLSVVILVFFTKTKVRAFSQWGKLHFHLVFSLWWYWSFSVSSFIQIQQNLLRCFDPTTIHRQSRVPTTLLSDLTKASDMRHHYYVAKEKSSRPSLQQTWNLGQAAIG